MCDNGRTHAASTLLTSWSDCDATVLVSLRVSKNLKVAKNTAAIFMSTWRSRADEGNVQRSRTVVPGSFGGLQKRSCRHNNVSFANVLESGNDLLSLQ